MLRRRLKGRFRLLSWPLASMADMHKPLETLPLRAGVKKTKYPFRLLRYWWVYQAILDETRRLGSGPTILDVGTEIGLLKSLAPQVAGARWIGLDRNLDSPHLLEAGYAELHECDLEQPLQLADSSADIVVCSHILEHLRNPENLLGDAVRILKPGGLLLVSSPILAKPVAAYYQRLYNRELLTGKRQPGQHVTAFHPRMWRRLASQLGMDSEVFAGSHILRWSGSRLENCRSWVRFNQFLAAVFPAFGNELCIQLRKPTRPASR